MLIDRIEGWTRVLGKAQGYIGLPVRDVVLLDNATGHETPAVMTAWRPLPDELERIMSGAPIYLTILGEGHPPVMMTVGEKPE